MNDFNPVYVVGDSASSASPIRKPGIVILVGDGDRAWMEARVPERQLRPLGRVRNIAP